MNQQEVEYAGFWIRVLASLIDSVLVLAIIAPVLSAIYGPGYWEGGRLIAGTADFLLSWVAPAVAVIVFWIYKSATPGKMIVSAKVVDAESGAPLRIGQAIVRYLGYYVSTIALGLGLIWVGIDPKKQGWHDKIAGTVVIRTRRHREPQQR